MSGVHSDGPPEDGQRLAEPPFDLDPPGTYGFDGARSTQGFRLNRFALSLKKPTNRTAFLRDERSYLAGFALPADQVALVLARDWTGLIQAGGHLQALLKVAATVGQNIYHIGAHHCGVDEHVMRAACPRHVIGLGSLDD
jgi:protocatechuate 4,5-dioxygenase, alpha chain